MPPLVLAFHSVARAPVPGMRADMVVGADALGAEIARLRADGRILVAAGQLTGDSGEAALTFDDGWADALTVAGPLLRDLGVRGTFFLCPGLFGNRESEGMSAAGRVLTREEAGELHELGMELGAHSMHHPDLTEVSDDVLSAELEDSKAAVEEITGTSCRALAYPFGLHDPRVRAAAEAAGYALAFAFEEGPWHPYAVPRLPRPAT